MSTTDQITWSKLPRVAGILIVASLVVNIIIYLISNALGTYDGFEIAGNAFGIANVILLTVVFLGIATAVFGYLTINQGIPLEKMRIIAAIVVLLTLILPLLIPDTTIGIITSLELMHVLTGIIVISGLTSSYFWKAS